MQRWLRDWMPLTAMGLVLSSCSSSAPTPVGAGPDAIAPPAVKADQAPQPKDRQLLQASVPNGIPTTSRCYTLSTERVVFKVLWVESDNRSDWKAKAETVTNACDGTRVWDDKWYWYFVPPDKTRNLMLVFRNIDTNEYGYVVVKNTPTVWLVYDNRGGPTVLANDRQFKKTWTLNGRRIDIDVKNPNNTGGWTANDIWVSFGF